MYLRLLPSTFYFYWRIYLFKRKVVDLSHDLSSVSSYWDELRKIVRAASGFALVTTGKSKMEILNAEIYFLIKNYKLLQPIFTKLSSKRVLYAGQCYYNAWYLSRSLRSIGWKADLLNWDMNPSSQMYYHGQDFSFNPDDPNLREEMLDFYLDALYSYDVFHFSNAHAISFGGEIYQFFYERFGDHSEIYLLKQLGKKIVYTNNGCLDGVSQTSFSKWGPDSVCSICVWRNQPAVCSDEKNLAWGKFRNSVADYQCLLGGNRVDYNDDSRVHEAPEFYCLDKEFWHPNIEIPEKFRLPVLNNNGVRLYHAIGNSKTRTDNDGVNIKSSHIYLPLIKHLINQGYNLDLLTPTDIPNKEIRFLQVQSDIFLDMLSYGWFGANAREAMMLGKPVICYLRPEWLDSMRKELPEYVDELPVISATPYTIENVLLDLINNPGKRLEIGKRSRDFAVKWHSSEVAAEKFDQIYSSLLFAEKGQLN